MEKESDIEKTEEASLKDLETVKTQAVINLISSLGEECTKEISQNSLVNAKLLQEIGKKDVSLDDTIIKVASIREVTRESSDRQLELLRIILQTE